MSDQKNKQIHVMYNKETQSWYGKQDKAKRCSFTNIPTQKEAEQKAINIALKQKKEVSIHRKDNNQIREKNSYGSDPYPPQG